MGEAVQPSDGAAGDLASMRSRTEAAATPRLSSTAISTIIDLTGMSFSRNRKRKNQAGQDGKGRKRLTGDPVEAWQEEVHQKAKNAIDAAQEALWAHGPQSQECRDALRLADELVNINECPSWKDQRRTSRWRLCFSNVPCSWKLWFNSGLCSWKLWFNSGLCSWKLWFNDGLWAGSSGSAEGPGLASEEAEEKFSEIEVDEELEWFWPLAFVPIWVGSMCQFGIFHLGSWLTYEAVFVWVETQRMEGEAASLLLWEELASASTCSGGGNSGVCHREKRSYFQVFYSALLSVFYKLSFSVLQRTMLYGNCCKAFSIARIFSAAKHNAFSTMNYFLQWKILSAVRCEWWLPNASCWEVLRGALMWLFPICSL